MVNTSSELQMTQWLKQCWQIGSQGPCLSYEILQLEEGTGEFKMSCKYEGGWAYAGIPSSAGSQAPCRLGTLRKQFGNIVLLELEYICELE